MPMRLVIGLLLVGLQLGGLPFPVLAQSDQAAREEEYYRLVTLPIPEGVVLEVGGLVMMPSGELAVSSRRGDIYLVENPLGEPEQMEFRLFASGLHEVLGLAERDGWLYATQRGEVTRLRDTNGDGRADEFETVSDGWEINGDYHEYAFGSPFDRDGNLWVALCLTGSFGSDVLYRGWSLRITPDGEAIPTCSGLRSPGGMGMNSAGDMFFTDNQGPWNGTSSLKHLKPGTFQGHPGGNRWYDATDVMGPRPRDPRSGSRLIREAARIPELLLPAVHFPYKKMGQSASGIDWDHTEGKFGPFAEQMFVGDQTNSTVMRVDLELVRERYQGACFPFREGLASGTLPLHFASTGQLFAGGTNRGWGSIGPRPFSLQRLDWTGKVPFEILTMRARHDGFLLTFTKPVDPESAGDVTSYTLETYDHIYQADYGSPEVDQTRPTIKRAEVSEDGMQVRLVIDGLVEGHIHELHAPGVRSAEHQQPLLHHQAYYTLNYLPEAE
jgi:glucose/arabinose dehydrogenase